MNKYQEYLLSQCKDQEGTFLFSNCAPVGQACKDDTYGSYHAETGCFLIKQDPDITKTVYELVISKSKCPFIESVQVRKNNDFTEIPLSEVSVTPSEVLPHKEKAANARFIITTDFGNRIEAIKLKFIKNIADDLEIRLAYQEADRQAYERRQEALRKENTLRRAAIKHSVGESLVNIYFQPCADGYDNTEISLFIPDKIEVIEVGGRYGPVKQENVLSWSLIVKATVENGIFFKSIPGLAYGRYAYIVKQFDKDNHLLIETKYIEFQIKPQQPTVVEQGNVVVI